MGHLSTDLKLRAIQHYSHNHNYVETAELFQVPRTTLMRWVDRYQTENTLSRKEREYIAYKVHQKHVRKASELLRKDPTITSKSPA